MSNASKQALPENQYRTVHIDEVAAFPTPGERRFVQGKYTGRSVGFVPFDKELLGRDFLVHQQGEMKQIDALERIKGVLSRETPTMTISSVFARFLDWAHNLSDVDRDPNAAPQNMMLVLSGPGIGKTHTPKVIAKAFGYAHELIGSGEAGGDIDELVIAHEFKGNSTGDIFKKIEAELSSDAESSNKTLLISKLRAVGFAEDYIDELGQPKVRLNNDAIMKNPDPLPDSGGTAQDRTTEDTAKMEQNIKAVWQIAHDCELDVKDEGGIGIQKVNGRLLSKLLDMKEQYDRSGKAEPVIITLDEFNRFKSFGKKLQNFWEVVGGASQEPVKLVDANGVSHTFTPDMLRYVFIYMTGNDPKKVPSARELDYSMLDRIGENRVFRLDDFSVADWQHRLEQQLMGIGIDMHYRAGNNDKGGNFWADHPDEFTKHLLAKREQGTTPNEKLQYTAMQKEMLGNWDKIHQGTGQVAQFFTDWVNVYKDPKFRVELRDMTSLPEISPRLMIHIINELRSPRVGAATLEANMLAKQTGKPLAQPKLSAINLGSRLSSHLKGLIDKTHPNKDSSVRHALYVSMFKNGIVTREQMAEAGYDTNEMQATTAASELVENLLNTDPNRHYDKELQPLQASVAEAIRQRYPDQREKSDDELITLKELTEAMKRVQDREKEMHEQGRPSDMPAVFRRILLPVIDRTEGKTHIDFVPSTVYDDYMDLAQIPESRRQAIKDGFAALDGKSHHFSTTSELLLGLAMAKDTSAQISELINPHAARAYHASTARVSHALAEDGARKNPNDTNRKTALSRAKRELGQAEKQLDQDFKDPLMLSTFIKPAYPMLANEHPSGLTVTAIKTMGYDETRPDMVNSAGEEVDGKYFYDTLSVVSVTQPDPEDATQKRSDVLIVGFSPISDGLRTYLHDKRHITYVCATEENAKDKVCSSLKSIVGMARAQLASKEPGHEDLTEESTSGLVARLQHCLNIRTADSTNANRGHPQRKEGEPAPDQSEIRISALAEHMLDSKNLTGEYNRRQNVLQLSWQELVAGSGQSNGSGRAA